MLEIIFSLFLAVGLSLATGNILALTLPIQALIFAAIATGVGYSVFKSPDVWLLLPKDGAIANKVRAIGFGIAAAIAVFGLLSIIRNLPFVTFLVAWFLFCCKNPVFKFLKEHYGALKQEYQKKAKEYERTQVERLEAEMAAEIDAEISEMPEFT